MPVTIKDIALRVGKSIATVSRALNDYDDISDETKALVKKIAAEMGYSPSAHAQRLQKRRSDTLGFILPTYGPRFSDPFFSEFLAGVGNRAAQLGMDLLVSTRAEGEQELELYRSYVQGQRVDGFVIVRVRQNDERINYLQKTNYPFVAFGRTEGDMNYPFVDEDGESGMRVLVRYLLDLGHERIGVITPPMHLTFAHFRLNGILKELKQAGLVLDQQLVFHGDLTQRGGYESTIQLLDLPEPPTAIIAGNDLMAFGAMSAAQERAMIVGKDISITGFDDIPMAEHSHPPLTTLHQPVYQIGGMISEMLIRSVRGEELENKQLILKPSLVIRDSCAFIG